MLALMPMAPVQPAAYDALDVCSQGFILRTFSSLATYLDADKVAPILYFTTIHWEQGVA